MVFPWLQRHRRDAGEGWTSDSALRGSGVTPEIQEDDGPIPRPVPSDPITHRFQLRLGTLRGQIVCVNPRLGPECLRPSRRALNTITAAALTLHSTNFFFFVILSGTDARIQSASSRPLFQFTSGASGGTFHPRRRQNRPTRQLSRSPNRISGSAVPSSAGVPFYPPAAAISANLRGHNLAGDGVVS